MTLVWTQSRVYPCPFPRHCFTAAAIPLASLPLVVPTRTKYHYYTTRFCVQRMSRYFQYPGTAPAFPLFHPRPRTPIPFFRLRGRPRVMRIEILSPCSIETNFADVWTLSGESWSVRKDTWTSFSKTLKRGNNFSAVRAN